MRRIKALIDGVNAPLLRAAIAKQDVALLLGDSKLAELPPDKQQQVDTVVCNFLKVAWRRRRAEWLKHCVAGNEWRLS